MMMTCLKVYSNTNPPKEFHIKQGECERLLGGKRVREINLLMKKMDVSPNMLCLLVKGKIL